MKAVIVYTTRTVTCTGILNSADPQQGTLGTARRQHRGLTAGHWVSAELEPCPRTRPRNGDLSGGHRPRSLGPVESPHRSFLSTPSPARPTEDRGRSAQVGGRGGAGRGRGSRTYYGHLSDEDPPNRVGHSEGEKPSCVRAPRPRQASPRPASPHRKPRHRGRSGRTSLYQPQLGLPELQGLHLRPQPPYARSVFSMINLTFSSVSSVIRTVGWLAYGITPPARGLLRLSHRACAAADPGSRLARPPPLPPRCARSATCCSESGTTRAHFL
jgi:hypothetical protein